MGFSYSIEDFREYVARLRAPNTAIKYADAARHFTTFCEEKKLDLDHLPANVLATYVSWMIDRKLSTASVNVYLAGTRTYLRWCEGQGLAVAPVRMTADVPRTHDRLPNKPVRDEALAHYLRF